MLSRAIIIAAALIAGAIMARQVWSQATTIPLTLGYVVTTCGTPPSPPASTGWAYSNGSAAPITMNTGGEICVSQ